MTAGLPGAGIGGMFYMLSAVASCLILDLQLVWRAASRAQANTGKVR